MFWSRLTGWPYFAAFVAGMIVLYSLAFVLGLKLRAVLSQARVERLMAGRSGLRGYLLAAALGAVTPFCSCTTVPIFAGMLECDVRLGYAMSFLIASPTINPPGILLLWTLFGWRMTIAYVGGVFLAAVGGGWIFGRKRLQACVPEVLVFGDGERQEGFSGCIRAWGRFMSRFAWVILFAAGLATLLKGWTPPAAVLAGMGKLGYAAIPPLVGLGIVIYADLLLLLPMAQTLIANGLPAGTVFAFVLAASGVGIPSIVLLSKLLQRKLVAYYVAVLAVFFMGLGAVFNLVLN